MPPTRRWGRHAANPGAPQVSEPPSALPPDAPPPPPGLPPSDAAQLPPPPGLSLSGAAEPPPPPGLSSSSAAQLPPPPGLSLSGAAEPPPPPGLSLSGAAEPPPPPGLSSSGTAQPASSARHGVDHEVPGSLASATPHARPDVVREEPAPLPSPKVVRAQRAALRAAKREPAERRGRAAWASPQMFTATGAPVWQPQERQQGPLQSIPEQAPMPSPQGSSSAGATQLAVSPTGSRAPGSSAAAQPAGEVALRVPDLRKLQPAVGLGGTAACRWQHQLRATCIAAGVPDQDVTDDPHYNWKQLLGSASTGFAERIIGVGIVRVRFRILETERDPNYSNVDGHGKHVFEFLRSDGSGIRLHYHKNGTPDEPTYVGPHAVLLPGLRQRPVAAGGAA